MIHAQACSGGTIACFGRMSPQTTLEFNTASAETIFSTDEQILEVWVQRNLAYNIILQHKYSTVVAKPLIENEKGTMRNIVNCICCSQDYQRRERRDEILSCQKIRFCQTGANFFRCGSD